MRKFLSAFFLTIVFGLTPFFISNFGVVQKASAISICDVAPFLKGMSGFGVTVCDATGNFDTDLGTQDGAAAKSAGNFIRLGLSLVFVGIIAFAIYTIVRSAITYIQSEGDDEKVEAAKKSIKYVFIGIGALFVGIIGIIIIVIIFGATGSLNVDTNNTGSELLNNFIGGLKGGVTP